MGERGESTSNSGLLFPGNHLLFQQVPMVEIKRDEAGADPRSILHYIADKHHLFGKDLKERTLYCGSSGVFSIVPLPMLSSLAILHSPWSTAWPILCQVRIEQTSRKVIKTTWKVSTESLSKMRAKD